MLTTSGTKRWTEGTLPREFCRSRMSVSDKRHLQGVDGRRIHGLSGELFLRFPQVVVAPDQPATPCLPRLGRNDGRKEPCHENSVGLVCPSGVGQATCGRETGFKVCRCRNEPAPIRCCRSCRHSVLQGPERWPPR